MQPLLGDDWILGSMFRKVANAGIFEILAKVENTKWIKPNNFSKLRCPALIGDLVIAFSTWFHFLIALSLTCMLGNFSAQSLRLK